VRAQAAAHQAVLIIIKQGTTPLQQAFSLALVALVPVLVLVADTADRTMVDLVLADLVVRDLLVDLAEADTAAVGIVAEAVVVLEEISPSTSMSPSS
jgi:hypothetical protein